MEIPSENFKLILRDVAEKTILVLAISMSAIICHHLLRISREAALDAWILLFEGRVFDFLVLADGLMLVAVTTSVAFRVILESFEAIKTY